MKLPKDFIPWCLTLLMAIFILGWLYAGHNFLVEMPVSWDKEIICYKPEK